MSTSTAGKSTKARRAGTKLQAATADGVVERIGLAVRDTLAISPAVDPAVVERAVRSTLDQLSTTARLRDVVQAAADVVPPAVLSAIGDQEQRWRDIESRHGLLDSGDVADKTGSRAKNRAEAASNLRTSGKALAVFRRGRYLFPGFQFGADGRVYPVIPKVIAVMSDQGWRPDSIVEWMDSPNGYLGGATPAERITDEDAVLDAATNAAHAGR